MKILKVRETEIVNCPTISSRNDDPALRPFSTFIIPPSPLFVRRARAIRGRCGVIAVQKERGDGGGGGRNAGEYNGYAKTEEAFMERRHVFPRAIPPRLLLRVPLIRALDRRSRKLDRIFREIFAANEFSPREESCFSSRSPPSLLFSSFLPLLLPFPRFVESSTRVNRVFCSVFDGGRLVARNRGERYKFGVNFVPGIIRQSIAAYIRPHRRESNALTRLPDSRLIGLIYLYRGFLSAPEKGGP